MTWEAIGTIAEVVGAFGVIATLIYVAYEIRQNTIASKLHSYELVLGGSQTLVRTWADESVATLFMRVTSTGWDDLSGVDRIRFNSLMADMILEYNKVLELNRHGFDDQMFGSLEEEIVDMLSSVPSAGQWWELNQRRYVATARDRINHALSVRANRPASMEGILEHPGASAPPDQE